MSGKQRGVAASPGAGKGGEIRRASQDDLDDLWRLEQVCFPPERRASRASLRRSLGSAAQSVWVVGRPVQAFVVLWHHAHALRIYDIATDPEAQGRGLGGALLAHVERLAREAGCPRVILEAAAGIGLEAWYAGRGYAVTAFRRDFYAPGQHAVRMEKRLG